MLSEMAGEEHSDLIQSKIPMIAHHLFGPRPYAEFLIAEFEGEPIGFCLYFFTYSSFRAQPVLFMEDMYLAPKWRNQGFAKRIVVHLFNVAVDRGCAMIAWDAEDNNVRALEFFDYFGAEVQNEWRTARVGGSRMHEIAASGQFDYYPRDGKQPRVPSLLDAIGLKIRRVFQS